MAKVIDITNKLSFDENPRVAIKGHELEINADAATVLKLMGILAEDGSGTPKQIAAMYDLLFPEDSRRAVEELKLSFSDFQVLVENALYLVVGGEDEPGE